MKRQHASAQAYYPKTCHAYSLSFLFFSRNASSSPPKSQMCQKMPRTWCSGSSAAGSVGWGRTASRILRNTPSSLALTGRTFAALKPPTFLMSAPLPTPPTLMWMMMYWKTQLVFLPLATPAHNSRLSNLFGLWTARRLRKRNYLKRWNTYREGLIARMHMTRAAVRVYVCFGFYFIKHDQCFKSVAWFHFPNSNVTFPNICRAWKCN